MPYKDPAKRRAMYEARKHIYYERKKVVVLRNKEERAGRPLSNYCEICGKAGIVCFDHCHTTGEFRGWLCRHCNRILGVVENYPVLICKMVLYLAKHKVGEMSKWLSKRLLSRK